MKRTNPTARIQRSASAAGAVSDVPAAAVAAAACEESSFDTAHIDDDSSNSSSVSSSATFDAKVRKKLKSCRSINFFLDIPHVLVRNAILSIMLAFALWHVVLGRSAGGVILTADAGVGSAGGLRPSPGRPTNAVDKDAGGDHFCTLYMAPSTLVGPSAGFGIFTARPFARGDIIKLQDGPSIPVTDAYQVKEAPHLKILGDKWWGELKGQPISMTFEALSVMEYVAGFGSLPNFHPYLSNIIPREPSKVMDNTMLDRRKSPGAGASSVYTGKDIYAGRDVVAGEELFLDYGESYFDKSPEIFEDVPREVDYYDAASFVTKFKEELIQARDGDKLSASDKDRMARMFHKIKDAVAEAYSTRSASLLPGTYEDLIKIAEEAANIPSDPLGSNSDDEPDEGRVRFALAREMSTHHVTPSWLHSNGFCLDNVVHKTSTISDAGNGGFAARSLKAGEIIVPVPLYHVTRRDLLRTYPVYIEKSTGSFIRNETRMDGPSQLLVNYCFGNDDSSLLLCPITSVMHLNHCSTRLNGGKCGSNIKRGPNARLQWATRWHLETAVWLNKSVEEIEYENDRVLNLEVMATRDIEEGEEIFIDYGVEWEKAWEDHKSRWSPPVDPVGLKKYKSAVTMNEELVEPVPTNDLRNDRSPPGDVMTGCWYWPQKEEDSDSEDYDEDSESEDDDVEDKNGDIFRRRSAEAARKRQSWKMLSDDEILSRFAVNGSDFVDDRAYMSPHFWPCSIVSKEEGEAEPTYTVRIFQSKSHHSTQWERNREPKFLINYPRASIRYFQKPYRSVHHLPGAFRRFIGLPDDMWPDKWKNRRRLGARQGEFRVGDRVTFLSSSNKEKTGIVVHFVPAMGYDILSVRSGKVRTGVPLQRMKIAVRVKELELDKFYA